MSNTSKAAWLVAAAALALLIVSSALAANVVGTAKNDVLRGTPKADKLNGKAGNDRLFGLAGNDVLVGGPGADTLKCGPGKDTAVGDAADKIGPDCETVQGPMLPSLSVAGASVAEGNAGTTSLSFPVTLSAPVGWSVSVAYATANGSASAPSDFAAGNGTLTFAPGETSKTISVSVAGDTAIEPDETLTVQLASPVNATIGTGSATGTIRNDDTPKPRAGHWTGTTSQNRAISFDVVPDAGYITHFQVYVDLQCPGIQFQNELVDLGDSRLALRPDWSFAVTGSDASGDVSVNYSFTGLVSPSGSASGTVRLDFRINYPGGVATCSTENVNWSAR
jgi:Ca2+-binding RTX toxin-like protein